jgi:hypothetical protein
LNNLKGKQMNDFIKLLKDYKVRVTIEYDARIHAIRFYLSQEQVNRQRRGMERCWSVEQLSKLRHPEDFIDQELKEFLGAFDGKQSENNDLQRVARKS